MHEREQIYIYFLNPKDKGGKKKDGFPNEKQRKVQGRQRKTKGKKMKRKRRGRESY